MKFLFFLSALLFCQILFAQTDSSVLQNVQTDSTEKTIFSYPYQHITDSNFLLNLRGSPRTLPIIPKQHKNDQGYFYLIAGLFLTLGIMKNVYSRYFSTLFRVFFNTSLRQSQLTDQLEQAKLPSLIFNVFFAVTGGLYIFFLLRFYGYTGSGPEMYLLMLCIPAVGICYIVKFFSITIGGWATDNISVARSYIFIIFLLNKIAGIILLPFVLLLAFSSKTLAAYAIFISVIILALLLLLRFYRAYSILQHRLKMTKFHFLLYVLAFELIPLAVIYKAAVLFLSVNT